MYLKMRWSLWKNSRKELGIAENTKNKKKVSNKEQVTDTNPLDFFGAWPDIPLDPKMYRKELWRGVQKL